jgi:hypothetical protein
MITLFAIMIGCGKTNQLTHITHTTPEDNHQAIVINPETSSGWSSYWKWEVVAFVGITGLILGYRHRGELSSAYYNVRFNYMKNADFRFFPDEPNHPIDVPNNQNNNPAPQHDYHPDNPLFIVDTETVQVCSRYLISVPR